MVNNCKKCKRNLPNRMTFPFCVKCAHCKKGKHILQTDIDGNLPNVCQQCDFKGWKKWFNKTITFFK